MRPNYLEMSVSDAAQFLDQVAAGWHLLIKVSKLDMAELRLCVLGQLYPTKGFLDAFEELFGISYFGCADSALEMNKENLFPTLPFGSGASVELWTREILNRRAQES